jgi:hypothetical protein
MDNFLFFKAERLIFGRFLIKYCDTMGERMGREGLTIFAPKRLDRNALMLGDHLEVLKRLNSESVDLIYLDPSFFVKKVLVL